MRILLLAPEPFYEERGTPIAVDLLARALCERGDEVDLLVYHLGKDRPRAGLRIHRIRPRPAPRTVPPGLSAGKLWCDLFMFFRAFSLARTNRHDLILAVEEASFIAMVIGRILRIPYVVDMDSSMSGQIVARYGFASRMTGALQWLESLPLRRAAAVVPVCEDLATVARLHCRGPVTVLNDVSLLADGDSPGEEEDLRAVLGIEGPVAMYIGNLQPYQGIGLMLDAFAITLGALPEAALVVIGGNATDIKRYQGRAARLGIAKRVQFIGPRPVGRLGYYMKQADVLVSPRIEGNNTPMKIYSYLDSGTAVVATDLPTHTQAVSHLEAALVPPEPQAMGEAIGRLLASPEERQRLAAGAQELIRRKHSWEAFRSTVHRIYGQLEDQFARAER